MNTAILNFELASTGADKLNVSGGTGTATFAGINTVNITGLGSSLTPGGIYTIVAANGITVANGTSAFKFSNGGNSRTFMVGSNTYLLTLAGITGQEQITVSARSALTWTGQLNGTGTNDSAWSTTAGHLNFATGTTPKDYTDGSLVTFQDINTVSGSNVTNSTVQVQAAGVSPGDVAVNNSAVNYTISNLSGATGIAGGTNLTKTGTGTLTLSSVNTYTARRPSTEASLMPASPGHSAPGRSASRAARSSTAREIPRITPRASPPSPDRQSASTPTTTT